MIATLFGLAITLQGPVPQPPTVAPRRITPVLAFPEPGLDDSAAYQGYQTRFYQDSRGNTIQIYLEPRSARVVHLWADASDASAGFSVRNPAGQPVKLQWGGLEAAAADSGGARWLEYRLRLEAPNVLVGLFLLGSMRVERDFQYSRAHLGPMNAAPAAVVEESLLVANVARLPLGERRRHLKMLRAADVAALQSRLQPAFRILRSDTAWVVRVDRPTLDGRHRLRLDLRVDPRQATITGAGPSVAIQARSGQVIDLVVSIATDATPLTPLRRDQIFNREFLAFLNGVRQAHDSVVQKEGSQGGAAAMATLRYRRLEREVRGVELVASEEKLMAGLPNFATYFGRDMLVTALMMRPVWTAEMSEHVIASVLRKLGPAGDVSHEEALGGQALREAAAEYNAILLEYFGGQGGVESPAGDSLLQRARGLLQDLQAVRENYLMLDDEFQLPVLAARYLTDSTVSAERKRAFLLGAMPDGRRRLTLLLRELALVAEKTGAYVREPRVDHLISFVRRDSTHWRSSSWRDSDAGYGDGRYAMDINAIWAPEALVAIDGIATILPRVGVSRQQLDSLAPWLSGTLLAKYLTDSIAIRGAIRTWRGARHHFAVTLPPTEIEAQVRARLAVLPGEERAYWETRIPAQPDSLTFLAIALDTDGRPIRIVNTDPATELFLRGGSAVSASDGTDAATLQGDLDPVIRPYPAGLFVPGLGPVVANDAYASRQVWEVFDRDAYHSPRVVWGREVNLLLLGLATQVAVSVDRSGRAKPGIPEPYVDGLKRALLQIRGAVMASGLEHSELWSYRIVDQQLRPVRYGTGSDVQLWSSTDLAVQFLLAQLPQALPPSTTPSRPPP